MTKFIYKLFMITTVFIYTINIPIYANINESLTKIENSVFGYDYSKDTNENRISRLEKAVYGKTNSGNLNNRITKLSGDISADVIGLEISPTRDTFLSYEEEQEESSVNYPIVDEIEQKLFNKTFKNRDFHTRIVTIEKKLFGKIYDVDDYSKRMNRIKAKIMPDIITNINKTSDLNFENELITTDNNKTSKMPFGQRNYTRPYSNYGDYESFSKTASNDNLEETIAQMEYDAFGTEFSNEDIHTRIKRLNSVQKAKKSKYKYDSQKFSQHMSTAMEIGAMILMILAMVL